MGKDGWGDDSKSNPSQLKPVSSLDEINLNEAGNRQHATRVEKDYFGGVSSSDSSGSLDDFSNRVRNTVYGVQMGDRDGFQGPMPVSCTAEAIVETNSAVTRSELVPPSRDPSLGRKLRRSKSTEDVVGHSRREPQYPPNVAQFRIRRRAFSFSEVDRQAREEEWSPADEEADKFLAALPVFERNTTIAMITKSKEQGGDRPRWKSKTEYLLTSIGYAVGLGNLWRFPYLCYENGGGVFLIPYFVCLAFLGVPMFLMEVSMGQKSQMSFLKVWRSISARLTGIGISSVLLALLCAIYYNVILAWSLYYFFMSFTYPLPWTKGGINAADSAKKFYFEDVLHKSGSMGEFTSTSHPGLNMGLFYSLTLAWLMVYFSVFKGIRSTGKVVYFTAIFPYIGLIVLLIRGVTLPGAGSGIAYYLWPDWSKLFNVRTWATAGSQIFYSLGIAWGSLVNFASFNPQKNNFIMDTYIVTAVNAFTSVLAGFVVFSVLGYMSSITKMPIEDVARAGSGLAFVVYPAGLGTMWGSNFFALLFFSMLICLGIDSQFAMVEVVMTAFIEAAWFKKWRKEAIAGLTCLLLWAVGLLLISPPGGYWVDLMDTFTGTISLYVVALCEVMSIVWIYGLDRFARDVKYMTGKSFDRTIKLLYRWVVPIGLVLLILFAVQMFAFPTLSGNMQFYEVRKAPMGGGCQGSPPVCGGPERGHCLEKEQYCVCLPGKYGLDCLENFEEPSNLACPEDCNSNKGRGQCDTKTGRCTCGAPFIGSSCTGDRYAFGWPTWGVALGWLFALGTLLPIPILAVVRSIRRHVKQGIDERVGTKDKLADTMELPPSNDENNSTEAPPDYEDSDSSDDDLKIYGTNWEICSMLRCRKSPVRLGAKHRRQRQAKLRREKKKQLLEQPKENSSSQAKQRTIVTATTSDSLYSQPSPVRQPGGSVIELVVDPQNSPTPASLRSNNYE